MRFTGETRKIQVVICTEKSCEVNLFYSIVFFERKIMERHVETSIHIQIFMLQVW